jgi:8-hydroxy-5-deazaflavin:NADPH oxidoreductase
MKVLSMKIAVIGTSETSVIYSTSFALAGHEVFIADKETKESFTGKPFFKTFENIHFCNIEDASAEADIIFVTAQAKDVREAAYLMGDVREKLIIDASANVKTGTDEHVNTLAAIRAITGAKNVVKVFSTKGYEELLRPLFKGKNTRMILVGERKAKEVAKIMTKDLDINTYYDFGGPEAAPLFDLMTTAWRDLANRR